MLSVFCHYPIIKDAKLQNIGYLARYNLCSSNFWKMMLIWVLVIRLSSQNCNVQCSDALAFRIGGKAFAVSLSVIQTLLAQSMNTASKSSKTHDWVVSSNAKHGQECRTTCCMLSAAAQSQQPHRAKSCPCLIPLCRAHSEHMLQQED